jgi:DnaJ-domain-containing protein 1
VDQIFDRLERLVKAWTNFGNDGSTTRGWGKGASSYADPDLSAAMAELDDFLDTGKTDTERREAEERERKERSRTSSGYRQGQGTSASTSAGTSAVVEDAYRYLGVAPYSAFADVKKAYKKLLFTYHPDRNSGSPDKLKRSTETSSKINAAYQIIEAYEESKAPR